jgi:hypothetical protein
MLKYAAMAAVVCAALPFVAHADDSFSTLEPAAGPVGGEVPAIAIMPVVEVTGTEAGGEVSAAEPVSASAAVAVISQTTPVSGSTPASHTDVVTPTTAAK